MDLGGGGRTLLCIKNLKVMYHFYMVHIHTYYVKELLGNQSYPNPQYFYVFITEIDVSIVCS